MTNSASFDIEVLVVLEEAQHLENAQPEFRILNKYDVDDEERSELDLDPGEQPTAICLSGGGIRSAAFCLGVLQAFAARSLLHQFHYLSTVSGGGYIGGWLTRCIAEQNARNPPAHVDVEAVLDRILVRKGDAEAPELIRLRRYTNFLTPNPGFVSDDTWAGIELWARNTLINWIVFLPLMLAVALVPIFYLFLVCCMGTGQYSIVQSGIGFLALAALGWAVYSTCIKLPSYNENLEVPKSKHVDENAEETIGTEERKGPKRIVKWTLVWTLLIPLCLAPELLQMQDAFGPLQYLFWPIDPRTCVGGCANAGQIANAPKLLNFLPIGSFVTCVFAYLVACLVTWKRAPGRLANLPGWALSSAASAFMLWIGARLAISHGPLWLAFAGPVWVMGAEMFRSAVYSAVRKDGLRSDLDREWLARLSGEKVRWVLAFGALGATVVFLPTLILDRFGPVWAWIVAAVGFLAGPAAAWLGKSVLTAYLPSTKDSNQKSFLPQDWKMDAAIAAAISVFAVALFMLLGRLAAVIVKTLVALAPTLGAVLDKVTLPWVTQDVHDLMSSAGSVGEQLSLAVVAALLGGLFYILAYSVFGKIINLNRFSMHAVYRNRLMRAFLGSARDPNERRPDAYTGFDPNDNVRVADTFEKRRPRALFPVINVALNRTSGKDTARAERKAEPFTITPLHCGSASVAKSHGKPLGAYVPTRFFAGSGKETGPLDKELGITLGTAMTLSGAAVSPNMGYHSSPFVAFVMTLFNVRLGAWLPNPGRKPPLNEDTMKLAGPNDAIGTMLKDLIGQSDDQGEFIYLSDGAHYDNLGLYEMLRRRCGIIVVVDAGEDGKYTYGDLGRTLEYALIDQGAKVTFTPPLKVGGAKADQQGGYASIEYADGSKGELFCLKPCLPTGAPTELQAFAKRKESFPHESTTNQAFTESDFESYRRLGEYLAGEMLTKAPHRAGEESKFAGFMRAAGPPKEPATA